MNPNIFCTERQVKGKSHCSFQGLPVINSHFLFPSQKQTLTSQKSGHWLIAQDGREPKDKKDLWTRRTQGREGPVDKEDHLTSWPGCCPSPPSAAACLASSLTYKTLNPTSKTVSRDKIQEIFMAVKSPAPHRTSCPGWSSRSVTSVSSYDPSQLTVHGR